MKSQALIFSMVLAASTASCSDDADDTDEVAMCDGEATADIPTRDIAEGICDSVDACTICVQSRDDAGMAAGYMVYEDECTCSSED